MPVIVRVELRGVPPADAFTHASGVRALVLRWFAASQPEVADALHAASGLKPYTISPLWATPAGDSACVEISLLADWLAPVLFDGIERTAPEVTLGRQSFVRDGEPQCLAQVSWDDLRTPAAPGETHWTFDVLTPTAHHADQRGCRKALVLPAPETYFGSWLARWNVCAPWHIDEQVLALVEERVAVEQCAGQTVRARLDGRRPFIGFVGSVTFAALRPRTLTLGDLTALATLARFAHFSGTGVDTMRGMGQTRFLLAD